MGDERTTLERVGVDRRQVVSAMAVTVAAPEIATLFGLLTPARA